MTPQWIGQWTGQWVSDRLAVGVVDDPGNSIPLANLVGLALRRNPRRAHLLVSTVLGKHVPTDPHLVYGAGRLLGHLVADRLSSLPAPEGGTAADLALLGDAAAGNTKAARRLGGRALPPPAATGNAAVVLGYAETATALGHCVAASLGWPYIHSTRRRHTGVPAVATFTEDHSHAVDHLVLAADPELLAGNGPLVLVDDELSTGRTAANTIRALHARWPRQRYVIAALIDLRAVEDRAALQQLSGELGVPIDVVSPASGWLELPSGLIEAATSLVNSMPMISSEGSSGIVRRQETAWPAAVSAGGRHGVTPAQTRQLDDCARSVAGELDDVAPGRVLVLGTEELMFAPVRIAGFLAEMRPDTVVRFATTTRSPAAAVDEAGYALRSVLVFRDPESGADPRFAYNVAGEDWNTIVVVVDDAMDTPALQAPDGLLSRLAQHAAEVVVVTLPDGVAAMPPRPRTAASGPLRGPRFGSYPGADVGWLLTDLSGVALEAPTEEREEAIQAGTAHYAESLPIEYQPSVEYQRLFRTALDESAERIALAVGIVTEILLAERGDEVVLASLARAGTPIGVLMRRWARFAHGLDLAHYAVSIVRGRGIDPVALGYLSDHHDPRSVAFVDGWTGKGAIVRELAAAISRFNAGSGRLRFAPEVAVLADPGSCVSVFGTRDDFLIPSACLNSTVSGLVSRTVLNESLLGPDEFHGAKFYAELDDADVSMTFVDRVVDQFDAVAAHVSQRWKTHLDGDRRPTWSGWAAVADISERYGIGDVNLVKPGVGETTRVLLRRVPWRILVRPDARAELAHVELLATQRGVELEEVPGLAYSCVGLIHPRFTRGATGADGRRAR